MSPRTPAIRLVEHDSASAQAIEADLLDRVFFALSDPVRRAILDRLGEEVLLVSEIAAPFEISLQAVSRHIQVLVSAGLIRQERTGRISRCHFDVGPVYAAALWINRYCKYWQTQFDTLSGWLDVIEQRDATAPNTARKPARAKPHKKKEK